MAMRLLRAPRSLESADRSGGATGRGTLAAGARQRQTGQRETAMDERPSAQLLIAAYARGIFPMADAESREIHWYSPDPRAILPLDAFHAPRSLLRRVRSGRFEITTDRAFERVMRACAEPASGRESTWIDERLIASYSELASDGLAHSVEAWREGELVGGLYGVHLGAAFFGESMWSAPERGGTDASKVCLVHLVERLRAGGFELLDTQFRTAHLDRFGCVEISRADYLRRLARALRGRGRWG
jgi:leucyl/phenylalanyl-tRNA--protein transferase